MEIKLNSSRTEQIDRWAEYIRMNPEKWREQHTQFLDAQFEMANAALRRIAKSSGGREKIAQLKGITNSKFLDEFCR